MPNQVDIYNSLDNKHICLLNEHLSTNSSVGLYVWYMLKNLQDYLAMWEEKQ